MKGLRSILQWFDTARRARATAHVLERLDPHLMDDLGICPATVEKISAEAVRRATESSARPVQGSRGI